MVNYLALMGWAPGNDVEILPLEEIVKLFDVENVNKTGAIFDMDKLSWMNSQYIREMDLAKLVERTEEYLKSRKFVVVFQKISF